VSVQEILIVAGPNGAGKTTFARNHLDLDARGLTYLNADVIAERLSPGAPELADVQAGRQMLAEMDRLAADGRSFAFETTLSGRGYLRRIQQWRADGYHVTLMFLRLPSVDLALSRVRERVALGGHDVPARDIHRRYHRGIANFRREYAPAVDDWLLFDSEGDRLRLIEWSGDLV